MPIHFNDRVGSGFPLQPCSSPERQYKSTLFMEVYMGSEKRQRCASVHVRLTPTEFALLQAQAADWNSKLPPDASPNARMTLPRLLVASVFRRLLPCVVAASPVPVLSADELAELRQLRAATSSLGNLFRAWIRQGAGVYKGKGGSDINVIIGPTRRQIKDGDDLISALTDVNKRISTYLK